MPRDKPKKLKEVLQMVSFENTAVRIDGWTKLHNHAAVYRGFLDETQWLFLRNLLWSEKEGGVLRAGLVHGGLLQCRLCRFGGRGGTGGRGVVSWFGFGVIAHRPQSTSGLQAVQATGPRASGGQKKGPGYERHSPVTGTGGTRRCSTRTRFFSVVEYSVR